MAIQFVKATKKRAKARVAIDGPSGAGKTYTALIAATVLAEGGKIAVIDTERGSASLYSDKFDFDVLELNTFSPKLYTEAINAAEAAGYAVIVIDSLTHAWEGEGGALDLVDEASARIKGNSYAGWKDVTPLHRKMVDAILQSPCHVIATMRSKMDYVQEKDDRTGKTSIRKVGMAPIQRQGMEYEFTVVGDMDVDHTLVISKSRCDVLADAVAKKPGPDFFKKLLVWLNDGQAVNVPNTGTNVPETNVQDVPQATQTPQISTPAPQAVSNTPNAPQRPYAPETLKKGLHEKAKKQPATSAPVEMQNVAAALEQVLGGSAQRYEFTRWLTDGSTESLTDVGPQMVRALNAWLKPAYNRDAKTYEVDQMAQSEATAAHVAALKWMGQAELGLQ